MRAGGLDPFATGSRGPAAFRGYKTRRWARLVAGYLVDDAALATSFNGLREDLAQVRAGLGDAEAFARTIPERERYRRLVQGRVSATPGATRIPDAEPDESDQRSKPICPTAKGKAAIDAMREIVPDVEEEWEQQTGVVFTGEALKRTEAPGSAYARDPC